MRRAVAVALLAACALLACSPVAANAAPVAPATTAGRVVAVLVPDLRWDDLAAMPALRGLMARGAVGVVSVRTQDGATRCGDGLLEISAMTRVPGGVTSCAVGPARLAGLRRSYRHNRYDAHVGLLGDLLGRRIVGADATATTVTAPSQGGATSAAPSLQAAVAGPSQVVVAVDSRLYDPAADRAAAAAAVDAQLAAAVSSLPAGVTVMVAGTSDGRTGGPRLHPMVVVGPGWPHAALASASTGRAPYVQLFDIGPTLLAAAGVTGLPPSVAGRPVHATAHAVATVASYLDLDRHARRALTVGHPTFTVLCAVLLGCLLLLAAGRREAGWVAQLVVGAPLAAWLVQLLPWWRWPVVVYALVVAALAVAAGFAWRAVPAVTAAVLLADQVVGARLQLAAPFGDNPLIAGRFHGMGNIAFGVSMGALLLCAASARRPAATAALVLVAVVVDGAPMLGDDVGGVLALVVAGALLVALRARVRVTAPRAIAAAALAVAAAALVGGVDYARPADRQTHAGRFVGQVLHGGAWQVVHRKLDAVLASFTNPVVTALVVACVAALVVLRRRLDPAAAAVTVLAVAGTVLNDSGVFVAAAVALAVAPALVLRALRDNHRL